MTTFHASSVTDVLAADLGATLAHRLQRLADPLPECHPRLLRMLDYIDANLGECELDERMIRAAFGLSRPSLYRLFQALGGVARYIRERRLWLAHRHLQRNPGCSLTWLLYEVGFASERQFQRAFQARFGMSPAAWRQTCRHQHPHGLS
ncbi:helix-turn-helix domain-containing protein [Bacillus subtilis subsp. subtilis]|nr:helix-turn-helix domain-containing protein [Bacillus subtilis subsp. subtilis]